MRVDWLLLSFVASILTSDIDNVKLTLDEIKNTLEKQNLVIFDIQEKLHFAETPECSKYANTKVIEYKIENRVLKKLLNVFSDKKQIDDQEMLAEKIEVERRAKILLPKLEIHINKATQVIEKIKSQLNMTRMIEEGLWEEAKKEVRVTQDIYNKLNASSKYFMKSKVCAIEILLPSSTPTPV